MDETLTGGCQCGGLRYELTGAPLMLYICHCQDCQKQSASAFGMSMPVPRAGFRLVKGTPKEWHRRADSGREVTCFFCPDCGTRLYHNSSRGADYMNLKPGTLDDTSWLRPVGQLWTRRAQGWVVIGDDMESCPDQSADFAAMAERWRLTCSSGH